MSTVEFPDDFLWGAATSAYNRDHIVAAHQAIGDGVDLRGLFLWALMDTYELNLGYTTQARTIKDSGYWYHDVIASNAVETA